MELTRELSAEHTAGRAALAIANLLPATLTAPEMTDEEFLALCAEFPDALLEHAPDGTVLIMPPSDVETSRKVALVVCSLYNWVKVSGRGIVTGPDAGFRLPGGSRRSPDASWFDAARWNDAKRSGRVFPSFAPEFLIELRSPNDRIAVLKEKMVEYLDNGVLLGWLIDPTERSVAVYRAGGTPEVLENPESVAGEGPVAGFVLDLKEIFS